jgi:diacylglycerol kinase (ATP)
MMQKPGNTGLVRLYYATIYSLKGFKAAWINEEAFRMEVCLCIIFMPASFFVGNTLPHQLLLFIACALVLIAELVNTAIESIVDRISTEQHPLSGQAKDLGSLVVFLSMTIFLVAWLPSLWNYTFKP